MNLFYQQGEEAAQCSVHGTLLLTSSGFLSLAFIFQAFKTKMSNMPTIKKFLQPGSPRKPPPDEHYVATVKKIFKLN